MRLLGQSTPFHNQRGLVCMRARPSTASLSNVKMTGQQQFAAKPRSAVVDPCRLTCYPSMPSQPRRSRAACTRCQMSSFIAFCHTPPSRDANSGEDLACCSTLSIRYGPCFASKSSRGPAERTSTISFDLSRRRISRTRNHAVSGSSRTRSHSRSVTHESASRASEFSGSRQYRTHASASEPKSSVMRDNVKVTGDLRRWPRSGRDAARRPC
jgi:hypothetical protein